jgi:hypothetical protein
MMDGEPGDDLIVKADAMGIAERVGTILEICGSHDHPEYLVHWVTGDYDSLISPWPGVHVRHRSHPQASPESQQLAGCTRALAVTAGS